MASTPEELITSLSTMEGQLRAYEIYDELRSRGPVVRGMAIGGVTVTTYDGCVEALHHPDAHAVGDPLTVYLGEDHDVEGPPTIRRYIRNFVLFTNPPDHARLRALLQKAFTPHMVRSMEQDLQQLLDGFVDEMAGSDEPDVFKHIAREFPTSVIATVLGIPIEEREVFKPLANGVARVLAELATPELIADVRPAAVELGEFVVRHIAAKREAPDDHLLSRMIQAEEFGDTLSEEEIVGNVFGLLIAGHDTTSNLIGNGTLALMTHRDQWDRLVADPTLAASAVEELLRYDAPFQNTMRIAAADMTIQGVEIAAGTPIVVALASGNRDPQAFDDPHSLDITRDPNEHLSFSGGIHYCLGNPLARLEGRLVFTTLATRFPDMALDPDRPVERRLGRTLRGLLALPVKL